MKASIAIADDHAKFRHGLTNLLKELDYDVLFDADNGQPLVQSGEGLLFHDAYDKFLVWWFLMRH